MNKIIILNGPPRCGKDTAYNFLKKSWPTVFDKIKFATPLKDACHMLVGAETFHEDDFELTKDEPTDFFFGASPREFYIDIAEYVKRRYTQEFFGYVFLRRFRWKGYEHTGNIYVISDCGFKEELLPLKQFFGEENMALIRIHREGKGFEGDSRGYISDIVHREYDVINPENDFPTYYRNILDIIKLEVVHDDFVC